MLLSIIYETPRLSNINSLTPNFLNISGKKFLIFLIFNPIATLLAEISFRLLHNTYFIIFCGIVLFAAIVLIYNWCKTICRSVDHFTMRSYRSKYANKNVTATPIERDINAKKANYVPLQGDGPFKMPLSSQNSIDQSNPRRSDNRRMHRSHHTFW